MCFRNQVEKGCRCVDPGFDRLYDQAVAVKKLVNGFIRYLKMDAGDSCATNNETTNG